MDQRAANSLHIGRLACALLWVIGTLCSFAPVVVEGPDSLNLDVPVCAEPVFGFAPTACDLDEEAAPTPTLAREAFALPAPVAQAPLTFARQPAARLAIIAGPLVLQI